VSTSINTGAVLDCAGRVLDLSYPRVMGVPNVTPDSFSDGGILFANNRVNEDLLCRQAEGMVAAGAAVLDIGGESTRPGAAVVSEQEELDRVLPAVEVLADRFDAVLSLDTSSPQVIAEGARLGAGMINDVRALTRPGALAAAAAVELPVCLMHMAGEPDTMQRNPQYRDVVSEICEFLRQRIDRCVEAGIAADRIVIDPGFGFGKTATHNFTLLKQLQRVVDLGYPVLAGLSRKSMIAHVIQRDPTERLAASLSLAVLAAMNGARLLRVHDVRETVDALAMLTAMENIN